MLPNEIARTLREDPLVPASPDAALADVHRRAQRGRTRRLAGSMTLVAALVGTIVAVPLLLNDPAPRQGPNPAEQPSVVIPEGAVPWSDEREFEEWEPPDQGPLAADQPERWPDIRARLTIPSSVQPGETLQYVVTLNNAGAEPINLAPCGGYTQTLAFQDMNTNDLAPPVVKQYRLNCDAEPVLLPGESRAYEMRLRVPEGALQLEEARLIWQLVDSSPDFSAQEFVTVGRPPQKAPLSEEERAAQLMDAFVEFALEPHEKSVLRLRAADDRIALGLGRTMHQTLTLDEAARPDAWRITPGVFRGHDGTYSALESIRRHIRGDARDQGVRLSGELMTSHGSHPHCAGPAVAPPDGLEDLHRVSVQPATDSISSCPGWFTVDLFIDNDDRLVAVTLDLWEP